jgi:hypothetical protein
MARWSSDQFLDEPLNLILNNCTEVILTNGEPAGATASARRTDAIAKAVHTFTVTSADFTISDNTGANGGRQILLADQNTTTADSTGTADHVAYIDGSTLYHISVLTTSVSVTVGNPLVLRPEPIIIGDPTAP